MTTPEPVSSAPDTEALRQQAAKDEKTADAERVEAIRSGTLDDAANAVFEALGGYPGPEVVTFGQALEAVRKQRADLDQALAERDSARAARDRMLSERAIAARVSGARTIPDDAAVDVAARWLLRAGLHVDAVDTKARADRMWQRDLDDEDRDAWRVLARELLADLGLSTPTTDPAPAAAARVCDCATCWPGSSFMHLCARCGNKRCPGAANHANECTGSNAVGQAGSLYEHVNSPNPTRCAGCNAADEFWCSCPDGYEPPAAPQAPAEPTEDAVLLAVAEDRMRRDTGERYPLDEVLSDLAGPAAREDTAPPDEYGDDLTAGFLRPSAPTEEKQ